MSECCLFFYQFLCSQSGIHSIGMAFGRFHASPHGNPFYRINMSPHLLLRFSRILKELGEIGMTFHELVAGLDAGSGFTDADDPGAAAVCRESLRSARCEQISFIFTLFLEKTHENLTESCRCLWDPLGSPRITLEKNWRRSGRSRQF